MNLRLRHAALAAKTPAALAAQQLNPAVVAVPMLLLPVVVVAVGRLLLIRPVVAARPLPMLRRL